MNFPPSSQYSRIAVSSWLCVLLLSSFNGCHPQPLTEVYPGHSDIRDSRAIPD
jgi:hypothetical protein